MAPQPETPAPVPPGPGFTVSHQKLELEIDFANRSVKGKTEITVHPTHRKLKSIALNCRQCTITRLRVNGRVPTSKYDEPYRKAQMLSTATVHQHHQLRKKIETAIKEQPDEELTLNLPRAVQIEELDPLPSDPAHFSLARAVSGIKNQPDEDSDIPSSTPPLPKLADEPNIKFRPLTVYVEFMLDTIRDGLQFIGCEEDDLRYPHVYTRNGLSPGVISSAFPCLDDISSRHTWEISIKCARTLGDAFQPRTAGPRDCEDADEGSATLATTGPDGKTNRTSSTFTGEDANRELSVMCSGEMVDEITDPEDPNWKIITFVSSTAVSPQHIGFAVGPFEHVDLSEFREIDEEERLGHNAIQIHGFCLPGRKQEVRNTCFPTAKAIDFFTLTYGSYPYNGYSVCFVDDLSPDVVKVASCTICSNRLLFPEDVLHPIDTVTRQLTEALASQWFGVDIVPKEPTDRWITVGLSNFIADMFMKKLCGNNDYRFRMKLASDRVCELDVGRPPLSTLGALLTVDPAQRELMELKAPLVLFILDKRMAKASGSAGLSRIISRILLNAKVGDLSNGCITTAQFLRVCEKLGHTKLESFFQQWVHGSGCPIFNVTQRFNKKKLVVEMTIEQVQAKATKTTNLEPETFIRDVMEDLSQVPKAPVQPVFTGSMTIRIHEADGSPYEHIVDIRELSTKFDIPYNTKYKRLKRSRRQTERAAAAAGVDPTADNQEDALLYCLGDVLQSEDEMRAWRLSDFGKDEDDKMGQESYEWIRMDADFEWICKTSLNTPWYMFLSQLQQDRDVVAQYESVQRITDLATTAVASTNLVRVLMDTRYFHGIRTAAAHALAKYAKDELDWIGLFHLQKVFQKMFCFSGSSMTRSNDFSDRTAYYMQCTIPQAMANVRDNLKRVPLRVQQFLLDLLRFNDNSNNEYSDAHYLSTVMTALCDALISGRNSEGRMVGSNFDGDEHDSVQQEMLTKAAVDEIERYGRMDEWILSFQNIFSRTASTCKRRLMQAKVIKLRVSDFLQYTQPGNYDTLRLSALKDLVDLGTFRQDLVMRYFVRLIGHDPSPYVRDGARKLCFEALASIGIGEDHLGPATTEPDDGLIIEQEPKTEAPPVDLSRKQTRAGAMAAMREEMGEDETLKEVLWEAVLSKDISMFEMRYLLDLMGILYLPETSLIVKLKYPRYWRAENLGKGQVKFTQTGNYRTKPLGPRPPELSPSTKPASTTAAPSVPPQHSPSILKIKKPDATAAAREPTMPVLPKITFKKRPRPEEEDDADRQDPSTKERPAQKAKRGKDAGGAVTSKKRSRPEEEDDADGQAPSTKERPAQKAKRGKDAGGAAASKKRSRPEDEDDADVQEASAKERPAQKAKRGKGAGGAANSRKASLAAQGSSNGGLSPAAVGAGGTTGGTRKAGAGTGLKGGTAASSPAGTKRKRKADTTDKTSASANANAKASADANANANDTKDKKDKKEKADPKRLKLKLNVKGALAGFGKGGTGGGGGSGSGGGGGSGLNGRDTGTANGQR